MCEISGCDLDNKLSRKTDIDKLCKKSLKSLWNDL